MKKTRIFLAVLLIMALFAFAGCAGDDNTLDPDTPNNNSTTDGMDNNSVDDNNGNDINGNDTMDKMDDEARKITDGAVDDGMTNGANNGTNNTNM